MLEHIIENWELSMLMIGVFLGIGEARYRVVMTEKAILQLKTDQSGYLTIEGCSVAQGACKAVQCIKHSQYKEESKKLMRLIEHVSEKSDKHYENMLTRMDANVQSIRELFIKTRGE
jgi:hypothetical protein